MMKPVLTLLSCAVLFAACTNTDLEKVQRELDRQAAPASNAGPSDGPDEARVGALPPQDLAPGTCGLFLWARTVERNLIFFSQSSSRTASMVFDGEPITLTRTLADGQAAFGQFSVQAFSHPEVTARLNMTFDARRGMTSGVAVPSGTLRLVQADGWEIVLPVGGLVACTPLSQ